MNFPKFLLLLVSNLIPLWSVNILGMILILLNLLRLVLWPVYRLSWKDVPRVLEKMMFSAVAGWSVLVRASVFLSIFCLLSIIESEVDCDS